MHNPSRPIRVLFLVSGNLKGLAPSARFRVYAYTDFFKQDNRFRIKIAPSIPAKHFYEHIFFKRHPFFAKLIVPLGFLLMFAQRAFNVLLALFYDVVFLQKPFFPGKLYPLLEVILCKINKHVIFDYDDAIFVYHEKKSKQREFWLYKLLENKNSIQRIIKHAAHITAGNAYLADYARPFNPHITIIPTPIDTDHYQPRPVQPSDASKPITIGWIGTSSNLAYLEELQQVFLNLQAKHNCILKIVCNPVAYKLKLEGVNYQWKDWSIEGELNDLDSFDIGIMPLVNDPWAKGKCGFKLLQYMACGIPIVSSPVGVNAEIIHDGQNGFLAQKDTEWFAKIEQLITDEHLRGTIGKNGRETVEANYSLRQTYQNLSKVVMEASR